MRRLWSLPVVMLLTACATGPAAEPAAVPGPPERPVFITGVDPVAGTLTFDEVRILSGPAAVEEWTRRFPELPDRPADGDLVLNDHEQDITMPVTAGTLDGLAARLAGFEEGRPVFWLTVAAGRITAVRQRNSAG